VLIGLGYLLAHLAAYLFLLRLIAALRTERGVFLYHFVSFCAFVAAAAFTGAPDVARAVTYAFAAAAAHGIYSMSFLELWSLSQISYSFDVLHAIQTSPGRAVEDLVTELARTGDAKKAWRIASLAHLGLVTDSGDRVTLTPLGRSIGMALRGLRWLANLRETG
jgi:hypothetical protein